VRPRRHQEQHRHNRFDRDDEGESFTSELCSELELEEEEEEVEGGVRERRRLSFASTASSSASSSSLSYRKEDILLQREKQQKKRDDYFVPLDLTEREQAKLEERYRGGWTGHCGDEEKEEEGEEAQRMRMARR